jgi:hypothetical protein
MEVVDVGSIPATQVLQSLFTSNVPTQLTGGHGAACFALPGTSHSRAFYEALIEHSEDIDAATRHHVAFIVFYGNRSRALSRTAGYRPFENYGLLHRPIEYFEG